MSHQRTQISSVSGAKLSSALANRKGKLELRAKQQRKTVKTRSPKYGLSKAALDIVKKENWLEDEHMEITNQLLRKQFPNLAGLQPPGYGQDFSFPIIEDCSFIQILHVQGNHWVTVAGSSSSMVHVYDSLYGFTTKETKMQVASIICSNEPKIGFKVHKIQFQKGSVDCGLFAIAYATDLAFGNDPASFKYDQTVLRTHFLDCIAKNELVPFPKDVIGYTKPKIEHIKIYCSCRLPDNGKEKMAKCVSCSEWFHQSCQRIPPSVFNDKKSLWKCSQCTSV